MAVNKIINPMMKSKLIINPLSPSISHRFIAIFILCLGLFVGWSPIISYGASTNNSLSDNQVEQEQPPEPKVVPKKIVVLDPGHGGKDRGLKEDKKIAEKEFTLQLALATYKQLKKHHQIEVYLTRKSDKTNAILERTIFSNRKQADAFISIHGMGKASRKTFKQPVLVYINQYVKDIVLSGIAEDNLNQGMRVVPWDLAQNGMLSKSRKLADQLLAGRIAQSVGDQAVLTCPLAVLKGIRSAAVVLEFDHTMIPSENNQDNAHIQLLSEQLAKNIMRYLF